MKRLLTGLKPTGDLTLGNFIGGIKPLIDFQNDSDNEIFLFVADLHALTVHQDPELLRERVKKFVAMYIACGVDPNKMVVYVQSENVYIPAISWILECNTYYGEASRMIQFKEKSKGKENFSIGLLTYPILMAADILYCDSDYVPVGIDQKQHVELARDIAMRFNKTYGETFKMPKAITPKVGTKIKDLKNPDKKMSKSEEEKEVKVANGISLSSGLVAGGSIIGLVGIILQVTGLIKPRVPSGFAASNMMGILLLIVLVIATTVPIMMSKVKKHER